MKEPHRESRTFFLHQPAVDRHVDHRLDSSIDIFSRLSKIRNCQRPRASTRYSPSEQRPPGDRTKSKNPSLKVPEEKALRKNRVPEKKQPLSSSNDSTEYFCDSLFLSPFFLSPFFLSPFFSLLSFFWQRRRRDQQETWKSKHNLHQRQPILAINISSPLIVFLILSLYISYIFFLFKSSLFVSNPKILLHFLSFHVSIKLTVFVLYYVSCVHNYQLSSLPISHCKCSPIWMRQFS